MKICQKTENLCCPLWYIFSDWLQLNDRFFSTFYNYLLEIIILCHILNRIFLKDSSLFFSGEMIPQLKSRQEKKSGGQENQAQGGGQGGGKKNKKKK